MSVLLKVSTVKEGTQAASLGIKVGDIVVSYDGVPLSSNLDLSNAALNAKNKNKEKVRIVVMRNDEEITMDATTDKLGVDCIEDRSSIGRQSDQAVGVENINTEYGVAKGVSSVTSFIGWGLVILGVFVGLSPLMEGSQSRYGGISWLAVLPGVGTAVSGFLLIMGAQVTKATVDTADYTRELLKAMRQK